MPPPLPRATAPVTKVRAPAPHLHLYPAELSNQNEGLLGVRYDWGGKFVLLICMDYSTGALLVCNLVYSPPCAESGKLYTCALIFPPAYLYMCMYYYTSCQSRNA